MKKLLVMMLATALLPSVAIAKDKKPTGQTKQHRLWDGTKADCPNANALEKNTAAWYEVCTSDAQKRTDDLRHELEGRLGSTPSPPPDDPDVVNRGRQHMKTQRQNIERARRNDLRSNRSTITGPIRPNHLNGGGTAPNKISRPEFLGGSGGKKGGIELGGEVHGQPGNLDDVNDAIKGLPR